ncbi:Na+/melibiose symporter-like transporter [Novosphingobium sp. PhB57]|uniref:MFS transporter n=1 Tax=Novosphingobium sp. PhB57 TaxID=2485107 RepID=UPI00104DE20A|nr:MFS transporter [Novosphingobium sp. PhB57]TCU58600.1 Na+/melibiose symporter-like transporter [Novosphingobium sp. PhB57]
MKFARSSSAEGRSFALFGLGQCARSILWSTVDLLIGYHFIERTGLSGKMAGAILFATVLISAFPDMFIAQWLAGRRDPQRAALKAQAWFGLLAALLALLLFGPKPEGTVAAIVYICVTSVLFRFAYAAYDVSQNALISLLPADGSDVARYTTNKTVMASVGRLIASLLIFAALLSPSDALADMKLLAITILPIAASGFGLARLARGPVPARMSMETASWRALPYRRLMPPIIATFFHYGMLGAASRFLALHGDPAAGSGLAGSLVISMVTGTIIGPFLEQRLAASVDKSMIVGSLGAVAAISGIALALPFAGAALLVLAMIYGTATSGMANLIWERVGTIAHDHRIRTGGQIDAPAFALLTTSLKLAIALSTLIFGLLIEPYRQGMPMAAWAMGAILLLGAVGTWGALRHSHGQRACILT